MQAKYIRNTLAFLLLGILLTCVWFVQQPVEDSRNQWVAESRTLSGRGKVVFVFTEGFMDNDLDIYVVNYSVNGGKPLPFYSIWPGRPDVVVWSGDGSIFAVRNQRQNKINHKHERLQYRIAYDFQKNEVIEVYGVSNSETQQSQKIERLIRERGGEVRTILLIDTAPELNWQLRRFKAQ
jgi:hypothetical protein